MEDLLCAMFADCNLLSVKAEQLHKTHDTYYYYYCLVFTRSAVVHFAMHCFANILVSYQPIINAILEAITN